MSVLLLQGASVFGQVRVVSPSNTSALPVGVKTNAEGAQQTVITDATISSPFSISKPTATPDLTPGLSQANYSFYGYRSYRPDPDNFFGLYEITGDTFTQKWHDPINKGMSYVKMQEGFSKNGKYCGYVLDLFLGSVYGYYWAEVDIKTGDKIEFKQVSHEKGFMQVFTLNRADNYIYGYGKDGAGKLAYLRAPLANPDATETVAVLEDNDAYCSAMTFNSDDNAVYGINGHFQFVKISDTDGKQTVISTFPESSIAQQNLSGLIYLASDKTFYWDPSLSTNKSFMYSITTEGKFTKLGEIPDGMLFTSFFTLDDQIPEGIPGKATLVENGFKTGNQTGSLKYRLPDTYADGKPLTGEITYTANADGLQATSGKGNPGEIVSVTYDDLLDGYHVFNFICSQNGKSSEPASDKLFIGFDQPLTPANVVLTKNKISWEPVTAGVHDGYVDLNDMRYEVYLNDNLVEVTKKSSSSVSISDNTDYTAYQAKVLAVSNDIKSEPAYSNFIKAGNALKLPVTIKPTDEQARITTVIDSNNDNVCWTYNTTDGFFSGYSAPGVKMDDYLFMPPVSFDSKDKYYTLSFDWKYANSYANKDSVEVVLCKEINGRPVKVDVRIMEPTQAPGYWTTMEQDFQVPDAGDYYLGFRCVSAPDQFGLWIRDIKLEDLNILTSSPALVSDLQATAAEKGGLQATVTFAMPTKTIAGNDIPAGTQLKAVVCANSNTEVTGTPGQKMTTTVNTVQGSNKIEVYVMEGEKRGIKAETEVYTGVTAPAAVTDLTLTASDDRETVNISWKAPKAGAEGGYINPEKMTYLVLQYNDKGYYPGWEVIQTLENENQYSVKVDEQELYQFSVIARNEAGDSPKNPTGNIVAGKLFSLPLEEKDLSGDKFKANPWLIYFVENAPQANWGFTQLKNINPTLWPDNTNPAFGVISQTPDGTLQLASPYYKGTGYNDLQVSMEVYGGENASKLKVLAERTGREPEIVLETRPQNANQDHFTTLRFSLPSEFNNQSYLRLYIQPVMADNTELFVMKSITMEAMSALRDASLAQCVITGETGQICVSGANGCDVDVYSVDGRKIASRHNLDGDCNISIQRGIYIVRAGTKTVKVAVK